VVCAATAASASARDPTHASTMTPAALNASPRTPGCASGGSRAAICASARARGSASSMARGKQNHYARRGKPPGIGHLSGDGEELSDPLRRQCHKAASSSGAWTRPSAWSSPRRAPSIALGVLRSSRDRAWLKCKVRQTPSCRSLYHPAAAGVCKCPN